MQETFLPIEISISGDDYLDVKCVEKIMRITQKVYTSDGITDDWERRKIEDKKYDLYSQME